MDNFRPLFSSSINTKSNIRGQQNMLWYPQNVHFPSLEQEPPPPFQFQPLAEFAPALQGMAFPVHLYHLPTPPPPLLLPPPPPLRPFCLGQNYSYQPFSQESTFLTSQKQQSQNALMTKIARSRRRMARKRSLLQRSSISAFSSFASVNSTKQIKDDHPVQNGDQDDLYSIPMPDGSKKLRFLLKKELRASDVGPLGRIVLPKREAEENLPTITEKEGIPVVITEVNSYRQWIMKYKYWTNNKSRMYVLENKEDFIKTNVLAMGDTIALYEDEGKNIYFSIERVAKPPVETSSDLQQGFAGHHDNSGTKQKTWNLLQQVSADLHNYPAVKQEPETGGEDEVKAEGPKQHQLKDQEDTKHLEAELPKSHFLSASNQSTVATEGTSTQQATSAEDDQQMYFNDCYGGLEILPNRNWCTYSFFDHFSMGNNGDTA